MPSLPRAAELADIVLIDASPLQTDLFLESIYDAKTYGQLKRFKLLSVDESLRHFDEFLDDDNVHTVQEALKDLRKYQRAVSEKVSFLEETRRRLPRKFRDKGQSKRELLQGISDLVFRLIEVMRTRIFTPQDKGLYDWYLEAMPHLLEDNGSSLSISPKNLQLCAAALYLTLEQGKSIAFLVNGQEFIDSFGRIIRRLPYTSLSNAGQFHVSVYQSHHGNSFELAYTTVNERSA